jgi:hypothetical protein
VIVRRRVSFALAVYALAGGALFAAGPVLRPGPPAHLDRRVELAPGRWYELSDDEFEALGRLRTALRVVRRELVRGGVGHAARHALRDRRETLEWEIDQLDARLLAGHRDKIEYYPARPDRASE